MLYERIECLIGDDGIRKLKNCKVAIFGVGGVGSFCVESLVRSGIGNIVLVDNDVIKGSNLNRQLMAYNNNLGNLKVDEVEKRILSIND
ncbi:MAG: ThiF family adenylyltransferase, partial [Erysipelotrichaceae bacterium]